MSAYTINRIQEEVTAAGSHWFDRGTMRFFGCRVSSKVYQGEGGIFFVTSEQPPHGGRRYSVRQYKPDTHDIETVGDFCELSRDQAHRQAAKLAGPAAIVAEESHRERTPAEQLALDIRANGGDCYDGLAWTLIRLATKHQRLMVDWCNGVLNPFDEDGEPIPRLAKLRARIETEAKRAGCQGVIFSGDPRGATVKLILPSGRSDSMGGVGWCVPTRD